MRSINRTLLDPLHRSAQGHADVRAPLLIVNGTLYYATAPPTRVPHPMLTAALADLVDLAREHELPDAELVLSVDDYPSVPRTWHLPLPQISVVQTRTLLDILAPSGRFRIDDYDARALKGRRHYTREHPWASKRNVALWRGNPYCGTATFGRCSRYLLAHLSAQLAETSANSARKSPRSAEPTLDVGLTWYREEDDPYVACPLMRSGKRRDGPLRLCGNIAESTSADLRREPTALRRARYVPLERHARARYLLALDGITCAPTSTTPTAPRALGHGPARRVPDAPRCSSRLENLIATNSLVLKQHSYYWSARPPHPRRRAAHTPARAPRREYYHDGLEPWVHFVPFWTTSPTDVLGVLANLSVHAPMRLEQMAARAQAFAHRSLSRHARSCYWRALLQLYADRLASTPTLSSWPRAVTVETALQAWPSAARRAKPSPARKRRPSSVAVDAASLRRLVRAVERRIAERAPNAPPLQTGVERRSPAKLIKKKKKRPNKPCSARLMGCY